MQMYENAANVQTAQARVASRKKNEIKDPAAGPTMLAVEWETIPASFTKTSVGVSFRSTG
jgi:hypothetical protein